MITLSTKMKGPLGRDTSQQLTKLKEIQADQALLASQGPCPAKHSNLTLEWLV